MESRTTNVETKNIQSGRRKNRSRYARANTHVASRIPQSESSWENVAKTHENGGRVQDGLVRRVSGKISQSDQQVVDEEIFRSKIIQACVAPVYIRSRVGPGCDDESK